MASFQVPDSVQIFEANCVARATNRFADEYFWYFRRFLYQYAALS